MLHDFSKRSLPEIHKMTDNVTDADAVAPVQTYYCRLNHRNRSILRGLRNGRGGSKDSTVIVVSYRSFKTGGGITIKRIPLGLGWRSRGYRVEFFFYRGERRAEIRRR